MLDRNDAIAIVRNYAQDIKSHGVTLRAVILFGSFAKGTQQQWSDIDVALVADEFTGLPQDHYLFPYMGGINKTYTRIEALTYPTDYFKKGDPLIEEITKTGIKIL
jgi:predicted nucleotidyltransferase